MHSAPSTTKRDPTYGELARALQRLGYVEHRNGTLTLFAHPRTKVDVILPKQRPAARVDDIHLVAVYQLVEAGGVATEAGLSAALDAKPA
jgi:hypothetical protein